MDTNQYAIELVTYSLVVVAYFYELIVYMLSAEMLHIQKHFFLSVRQTLWDNLCNT